MAIRTKSHSKERVQVLKKASKFLALWMALIMCIGLFAGCRDKDWSKDFDLSDEKVVWDESTFVDDEHTTIEKLIVIFKKTDTYPQLELWHFKMANAKQFVYTNLNPNEGELYYDGWRQSGEITLRKTDKQSIIDAIRHLEALPFVKSVQQMRGVPIDNNVIIDEYKELILPMDGAEEYTVGNGTEAYPYVINTSGQLIHFSNQINKGEDNSAFFALGSDIDLEGTEWTPIGILANKCFNGVFDGRGYEVSNFCITHRLGNSSAENVGLFGRNTGTIRNVGVTNFNIDISWAYKFGFVLSVSSGGLVGSNAGDIKNSYSIGNINLEYNGGATITAPAHIRTGDLVGYNTGKLLNCYSTVDVNAIYGNEVGTVYAAGLVVGGAVENCFVTGNVKAEYSYHTLGGKSKVFSIGGECFNSYSYEGQKIEASIHSSCSAVDLNSVDFYTRELSWDAEIWDLENLDFTNGKYADNKHPRLK